MNNLICNACGYEHVRDKEELVPTYYTRGPKKDQEKPREMWLRKTIYGNSKFKEYEINALELSTCHWEKGELIHLTIYACPDCKTLRLP